MIEFNDVRRALVVEKLSLRQQKILEELREWAVENGNQISYTTLLDILKNEH